MIHTKKELKFFLMADMMMNRGKFKWTIIDRFKQLLFPDVIMSYLKSMRYTEFLSSSMAHGNKGPIELISYVYHQYRLKRLGRMLGFSIGYNTLGYGVVIPHYGTIVIGSSNRIGPYAVLHTSTCITDNGKRIGKALYLATGAILTSNLNLGDNVSIGANSLVNKSFGSDLLIAGSPAKEIKKSNAWYIRDGENFIKRVNEVENLKSKLELNI